MAAAAATAATILGAGATATKKVYQKGKQAYSTASPRTQNFASLAMTFVVVGVGYKLGAFKWITEIFEPKEEDYTKDIKVNKSNLTRSAVFYKAIADSQETSMNKWGTDEDLLFDSLAGLNDDELKQVAVYYGKRCRIANFPNPFGKQPCISPEYTLFEWYDRELTSKERAEMAQIWNSTGLY